MTDLEAAITFLEKRDGVTFTRPIPNLSTNWSEELVRFLNSPMVVGILFALLPPLGGLLYFAAVVFVWVEAIRYIWMSDDTFDAKVRTYQAARPGAFAFFW